MNSDSGADFSKFSDEFFYINKLPKEILADLFINCFNPWDRIELEKICRHWKNSISYPENFLDVGKFVEKFLEPDPNLLPHTAFANWFPLNFLPRLFQFFFVNRNLGQKLKNLKIRFVRFDEMAMRILIDFCPNLQSFELDRCILSFGNWHQQEACFHQLFLPNLTSLHADI